MSIAQNIARIRSTLPDGVTLVAVSKFHPSEIIRKAYDTGQRIFGESRVQELTAKRPLLPPDIEWHFIGTLQTNKVKQIAPFICMIHSIDSAGLLKEVDRQAAKCHRTIRVLLEIHIAEETSKHGFTMDECRTLLREGMASACPNVCIAGLMGMATFTDSMEQVGREFKRLRTFFEEIKNDCPPGEFFTELSIGMSGDYLTAVANGSTMVRIGSDIFGERLY
ncbi:MAG: YggS family pyridoxal phosphate-dependent enzyme [Tannerella sp.]|jgi:pyridoxal phosphate enzyme (YggS family)|nr:YggS family pyridoxal phosphate-dependent enzyme [Tannerella sp.]